MRAIELNFIGERRTWPNQRHLPTEHIPELRDFIKARFADKSPHSGNAGIIGGLVCHMALRPIRVEHLSVHVFYDILLMGNLIGVSVHGTEFEHFKLNTVLPHPFLPEKDRSFRVQLNTYCNDQADTYN